VIVSGDRFKVVNVQWMVIEHKMTCDVYVA
jgi:hypothetical protein